MSGGGATEGLGVNREAVGHADLRSGGSPWLVRSAAWGLVRTQELSSQTLHRSRPLEVLRIQWQAPLGVCPGQYSRTQPSGATGTRVSDMATQGFFSWTLENQT